MFLVFTSLNSFLSPCIVRPSYLCVIPPDTTQHIRVCSSFIWDPMLTVSLLEDLCIISKMTVNIIWFYFLPFSDIGVKLLHCTCLEFGKCHYISKSHGYLKLPILSFHLHMMSNIYAGFSFTGYSTRERFEAVNSFRKLLQPHRW